MLFFIELYIYIYIYRVIYVFIYSIIVFLTYLFTSLDNCRTQDHLYLHSGPEWMDQEELKNTWTNPCYKLQWLFPSPVKFHFEDVLTGTM